MKPLRNLQTVNPKTGVLWRLRGAPGLGVQQDWPRGNPLPNVGRGLGFETGLQGV